MMSSQSTNPDTPEKSQTISRANSDKDLDHLLNDLSIDSKSEEQKTPR